MLTIDFILCKRNIITHFFSALSNRGRKKGKAEEEEEKMKRRIHFLTRMSTNVQLRPIWSQVHKKAVLTLLTAGIQAVFPPDQLWTTTLFIQTLVKLSRDSFWVDVQCLVLYVPVMSSTYSTDGAQLWLQSWCAFGPSPFDRWHFTQFLITWLQ